MLDISYSELRRKALESGDDPSDLLQDMKVADIVQEGTQEYRVSLAQKLKASIDGIDPQALTGEKDVSDVHRSNITTLLKTLDGIDKSNNMRVNQKLRKTESEDSAQAAQVVANFLTADADERRQLINSLAKEMETSGPDLDSTSEDINQAVAEVDEVKDYELRDDPYDYSEAGEDLDSEDD